MMQTPAPTLDDTTDPQTMRTRVLTALFDAVLVEHAAQLAARSLNLDASPAAAAVEVLDQAIAYWRIETGHGPYTVTDYREIATDMWTTGTERIPSVAAAYISASHRAAGLSY